MVETQGNAATTKAVREQRDTRQGHGEHVVVTYAKVTKYFRVGRHLSLPPLLYRCRPKSCPVETPSSYVLSLWSTFSACFHSVAHVHVTLPSSRTALRVGREFERTWQWNAMPHKNQR